MSEKKALLVTAHLRGERYPLLGMRWAGVFPSVVIAYCDEKSLPELIAELRVIGLFAGSCEAMTPFVRISALRDTRSKNTREKAALGCEDAPVVSETSSCTRYSLRLKEARRIAYASVQHLVAAAVVILYSKSIIGAALRAFVGN